MKHVIWDRVSTFVQQRANPASIAAASDLAITKAFGRNDDLVKSSEIVYGEPMVTKEQVAHLFPESGLTADTAYPKSDKLWVDGSPTERADRVAASLERQNASSDGVALLRNMHSDLGYVPEEIVLGRILKDMKPAAKQEWLARNEQHMPYIALEGGKTVRAMKYGELMHRSDAMQGVAHVTRIATEAVGGAVGTLGEKVAPLRDKALAKRDAAVAKAELIIADGTGARIGRGGMVMRTDGNWEATDAALNQLNLIHTGAPGAVRPADEVPIGQIDDAVDAADEAPTTQVDDAVDTTAPLLPPQMTSGTSKPLVSDAAVAWTGLGFLTTSAVAIGFNLGNRPE